MTVDAEFAAAVKDLAGNASRGGPAIVLGTVTGGSFLQTGQYVDVSLAGVDGRVRVYRRTNSWGWSFANEVDARRGQAATASSVSALMNGRVVLVAFPSGQPVVICTMAGE